MRYTGTILFILLDTSPTPIALWPPWRSARFFLLCVPVDYLNPGHSAFVGRRGQLAFAQRALLDAALGLSHTARLQWDRIQVERVLGVGEMSRLTPPAGWTSSPKDAFSHSHAAGGVFDSSGVYDIDEVVLTANNAALLRLVLLCESTATHPCSELKLHIESWTLLTEQRQIVLRANDANENWLFAFPARAREALLAVYADHSISPDAIEWVEIDPTQLFP